MTPPLPPTPQGSAPVEPLRRHQKGGRRLGPLGVWASERGRWRCMGESGRRWKQTADAGFLRLTGMELAAEGKATPIPSSGSRPPWVGLKRAVERGKKRKEKKKTCSTSNKTSSSKTKSTKKKNPTTQHRTRTGGKVALLICKSALSEG